VHSVRNLFVVIVLLILVSASPAVASPACSVQQAKRDVDKARAAYREAVKVHAATKLYSGLYGPSVGRWVKASRAAGWSWGRLEWMMPVMYRESRGDPRAKNPVSTASGLAQFLAFWWDGSDPSIRAIFKKHRLAYPWNPFDPVATLEHWRAVVVEVGTSPWNL
jgi:hypothetical protein